MEISEIKTAAWVAVAGGIGGLVAWTTGAFMGGDAFFGDRGTAFEVGRCIAYTGLGGGAGIIGVFLLANTDRRRLAHCMAFALVCGFVGRPIWDAGATLLDQRRSEIVSREVADLAKQIEVEAEAVESASTEKELSDALERGAELRLRLLARAEDTSSSLDRRRGDAAMQELASAAAARVDLAPEAVVTAIAKAHDDAVFFGRAPADLGAPQALRYVADRSRVWTPTSTELRRPEWAERAALAIERRPELDGPVYSTIELGEPAGNSIEVGDE